VEDRRGDSGPELTAATAALLVERAAQVATSQTPLAAGLRAAAQETDSPRLAGALGRLAAALERGQSLDDFLAQSRRVPPHLAGLLRAAQRTGELSTTLTQWIENRRAARLQWRRVISELAYPSLSILLACAVFMLFALLVVPPFHIMFEEFGLKLPANTQAVLWLCDAGARILGAVLLAGAAGLLAVRLIGGPVGWSILVTNLPLIGVAWHWAGVAEMLRCLSLLVEERIPLPEALRLTADGILDGHVADQCRRLATRVENGASLTMSLVHLRSLPLSIVPLVYWGERSATLAEALRAAAAMLEDRLKLRTGMLMQVIPPVMLVIVGGMAIAMVIALFSPLISLVQGLT
jgi:type II secretory pathway component PulF